MAKAREYLAKYGDAIFREAEEEKNDAAVEMFKEFASEARKICEMRHAKLDRAVVAVILEQNRKWNAVVRLFAEKYGVDILKRDGVISYFRKEIPEIERYLHG